MGNCISSRNSKGKVIALEMDQISRYPRQAKVMIKSKNSSGKVIGHSNLTFQLTDPLKTVSKLIEHNSIKLWASCCIIPGLDPRGECGKVCQDNCVFLNSGSSILLALFDGHGSDGDKVSQFCCKFVEKYYFDGASNLEADPNSFLIKLMEECDHELRMRGFDILYSGSTGVIVIYIGDCLYSASVGDSRAILGTTNPPAVLPAPVANLGEERKVLESVKFRRGSKSNPLIQPVQLTKDQKPEDPEEFDRIVKSGGRVQRLLDTDGNRIGPFRVWELSSNAPGLAMSRSIGDLIGKKIGVISTPICTKHLINLESDLFIILASDGVWDVMDNDDVVNFIECFREKCKRGNIRALGKHTEVIPSITCIAHLLCEESRQRWFSIVEDEDVMIDDISCIVLELKKGDIPIQFNPKKNIGVVEETANENDDMQQHLKKAPTVNEIVTRDPRRGSLVTDKFNIPDIMK
ncbi:hypothetical protein SteCoe_24569 [Stentor coeruleus]|uniref:PPM-type phosphatase domain-containing protein n=1 Tax=Stentor coeruleus TaxID=5963 RepID=A0A1R2BH74_9CILI|nr:hypothetical protein SteCoe_24569 [Stentor coeruleus]